MMEMSLLNPKIPSERRALVGYAYELGLLDFWNPPWPDFILKLADSEGSASIDMIPEILKGAKAVGHEARKIKTYDLSPRKILKRPYEAVELLSKTVILKLASRRKLLG